MVPPSWLAIVAVYAVIPLGGGSRARTMAGYLNHFRLSPGPRIAAAVIQGLALERLEGPDGVTDPIVPEDIQRSVIVLWTATFAGALLCAAFACSAYWLWGTLT